MDKLAGFKNITLTEAIKEIKKLRQSLIGAVQNAEYMEEKKDKEIEQLKKDCEEMAGEADKAKEIERLTDLNKAKGALIKAQAKAIGRLLKEKEWLLNGWVKKTPLVDDDETQKIYKNALIARMQQALKEGP